MNPNEVWEVGICSLFDDWGSVQRRIKNLGITLRNAFCSLGLVGGKYGVVWGGVPEYWHKSSGVHHMMSMALLGVDGHCQLSSFKDMGTRPGWVNDQERLLGMLVGDGSSVKSEGWLCLVLGGFPLDGWRRSNRLWVYCCVRVSH